MRPSRVMKSGGKRMLVALLWPFSDSFERYSRFCGHILPVILALFLTQYLSCMAFASDGNTSAIVMEKGVPKIAVNGKPIENMFGIDVYSTGVDAVSPNFYEDMREVIDRSASLGIPVMSFQLLWQDYDHSKSAPASAEEAATRFNTTQLDRILDYAAKRNVYVILQLLTHKYWALPAWWKLYKGNSSAVQLIGPPNSANNAYNRLQSPVSSYANPDHRELLTAVITKLMLRYRAHPAVIGWGINLGPTGENGYSPNYIELMFNRAIPQIDLRISMADYSPFTLSNFTRWLKKKYTSAQNLNRAWHTNLSDFSEAAPPYPGMIPAAETFNSNGDSRPSMLDWQAFRHESLMDEWRFVSGLVRRLDPGKLVMGKTNWNPLGPWTGSESMLSTAVSVGSEKLIDIDKVDGGLTARDYMANCSGIGICGLIDYVSYSRFSKQYGLIRVLLLENWVKRDLPGTRINVDRALAAKRVIKNEGCYLWFAVCLTSERQAKPDWSWQEVEELVKRCSRDELKTTAIDEPAIKYLYDVPNQMAHYYDYFPGFKSTGLTLALCRAIYDRDQRPFGYIGTDDLLKSPPDPARTKLLVVANYRAIPPAVAERLKKYSDAGGMLLLLGSNGVFDFDNQNRKDAASLRKLVPAATDSQVRAMYEWGAADRVKVPVFVVSKGVSKFFEMDVMNRSSENYQVLKKALESGISLPDGGKLFLSAANDSRAIESDERGMLRSPGPQPGRPPTRDFIKDFDKNGDGRVTRNEFDGDPAVFDLFDLNHDGVITPDEIRQRRE